MGAVGVGHVAVGVADVDRALGCYRDVLGLEVYLDRTEELPTVGRRRRAIDLRNQFEPYCPWSSTRVSPTTLSATLRARTAGFEVVIEPHDWDSGAWAEPPGTVIRTAMLKDPDGTVVQQD